MVGFILLTTLSGVPQAAKDQIEAKAKEHVENLQKGMEAAESYEAKELMILEMGLNLAQYKLRQAQEMIKAVAGE